MVYFVQPVGGGPIKIGTTTNLRARLATLKNQYGMRFNILAIRGGGRDVERQIHERFSHLRLCLAEQFRPGDDLMAFIGKENPPGFDPNSVEAIRLPIRSRLVFDVPVDLRWALKRIANDKKMTFKEYLQGVLVREATRNPSTSRN